MSDENKIKVKITLLGNSGVGKTCIISKFALGEFNINTGSTPGANYSQKDITINNQTIEVDIWDTAGQEKFRSLGKHFYKDSYIVCLVYDITVEESFDGLKNIWYSDLKKYGEKYTVLAVVGNKADKYEEEKVNEEEARKYAEEIGAIYMSVSAKTGNNIDNLFYTLVRTYLGPEFSEKAQEMISAKGQTTKVKAGKKKEGGGCCK